MDQSELKTQNLFYHSQNLPLVSDYEIYEIIVCYLTLQFETWLNILATGLKPIENRPKVLYLKSFSYVLCTYTILVGIRGYNTIKSFYQTQYVHCV